MEMSNVLSGYFYMPSPPHQWKLGWRAVPVMPENLFIMVNKTGIHQRYPLLATIDGILDGISRDVFIRIKASVNSADNSPLAPLSSGLFGSRRRLLAGDPVDPKRHVDV